MSDLSSYQSAETAWRYDSRLARLRNKIDGLQDELHGLFVEEAYLETHPPLYHLFNWSA